MGQVKDLGPELMQAITDSSNKALQEAAEAAASQNGNAAYDLSKYDIGALLEAGIADWSYDEDVSPENIGELDEATAKWAAQAILDITKPPDEAETKN